MDLRYHGVTLDGSRKPRQAWERLLELEQPDRMLILEGTVDIANWAAGRHVPTVFLGGTPGDTGIPMLGVHAGAAIREILTELIGMGHQRICLPVFARNEGFETGLRRVIGEVFAEAGLPFVPSYHVPALTATDPEIVWSVMAQLMVPTPPTALIFFMWDEFLAAQCFLNARGLRIPGDVSVVLLGGGEFNQWYRPKLTHFIYPTMRAAEQVARWFEDGPPSGKTTVSLPLKLVPGDSVAPPRVP